MRGRWLLSTRDDDVLRRIDWAQWLSAAAWQALSCMRIGQRTLACGCAGPLHHATSCKGLPDVSAVRQTQPVAPQHQSTQTTRPAASRNPINLSLILGWGSRRHRRHPPPPFLPPFLPACPCRPNHPPVPAAPTRPVVVVLHWLACQRFFSKYEFSAPHLMCVSDCEPLMMQELLQMADPDSLQRYAVRTRTHTHTHPAGGEPCGGGLQRYAAPHTCSRRGKCVRGGERGAVAVCTR